MLNYRQLLCDAVRRRESLLGTTDAYRVVNGLADGFPGLTLDKFGDCFQIQFFGPELLEHRDCVVEAILEELNPKFLVMKERLSSSGRSLENAKMEIFAGAREDAVTTVTEGNARFQVDLLDTVNPGLFLDLRYGRLDVEERMGAGRFLNLFSYTCSFSVHARLGGASLATNADISGKILDKGRANYALNGLDLRPGEFFRGNAIEYVNWAKKKGLKFEGIVLDPPSFARFKGFNFNVREHLLPLVSDCAELLQKGGFFLVSSNYSEFVLEQFSQNALGAVRKIHPGASLAWSRGQDIDFVGSGTTKDSCLVAAMIET